jgi:hypothetical protein
MTKVLLRTFSSDEHWNADFDYALIDLDAKHARVIADKAKLVAPSRPRTPTSSRSPLTIDSQTLDKAALAEVIGG